MQYFIESIHRFNHQLVPSESSKKSTNNGVQGPEVNVLFSNWNFSGLIKLYVFYPHALEGKNQKKDWNSYKRHYKLVRISVIVL